MSETEIVDIFEMKLRCIRHMQRGACDKDCQHCEFIVHPDTLSDALSIAIIKLRR